MALEYVVFSLLSAWQSKAVLQIGMMAQYLHVKVTGI
jgi:hypothetical protein